MPTAADALIAAVLADPADPLPRLVFADHLDDTGTPANLAWAEYIRRRTAAAGEPSALMWELMHDAAAELVPRLVASLTLDAAAFLADVSSFLNLLPSERFTLRLADFTPPRLASDDSHCRDYCGLPLTGGPPRPVIGLIDPANDNHRAFWTGKFPDRLFVRIRPTDLEPALQQMLARRTLANAQPDVSVEPAVPTLEDQLESASAEVMRAFLEQLVAQARRDAASAIDITPYATHHWVRRVVGGTSLRWHRVGTALGRELVRAARALSPRKLNVRVRQRNSSFGEGVRIVLLNPPVGSGVPAPPG